jgi:hypothetical protein
MFHVIVHQASGHDPGEVSVGTFLPLPFLLSVSQIDLVILR